MVASSFPEFITSRRRELELTLGDVANSLGVSPITVSNWSNGDSTPDPENLAALADLLDVSAERLAKMAGVPLTGDSAVNLMPGAAVSPGSVKEPPAVEVALPPTPAPASHDEVMLAADVGAFDEVPIPVPEPDAPPSREAAVPDAIDGELAGLIDEPAPEPDSVPPFVSKPPPAVEPAVAVEPAIAVEPAVAAKPAPAAARKAPTRRPPSTPAAPEREVITLPLTYIEDPRQLMRYRIRWVLTVVALLVMFIILLWASRELISALAEVKDSVTPGGIGGG